MPNYRYVARDKTGKSITAVMDANDEKAVIDFARQQGLILTSIKIDAQETKKVAKPKTGKKIKLTDLVLFSRQLATMIDSGIPLLQALEILSEQSENPAFVNILNIVKNDVATGTAFYEALAKHPGAFTPLFVNMVKAGESSGALDDIMERLASYLEKTDALIRKVKSAMTYPIVVSTMALSITLVMLLKVVPVFKSMFADFGAALPLPTQILVTISDNLISTFFLWFFGAIAGFVMLGKYIKTPKGRLRFDHFKLNMPVFGVIMRKVSVSKFCRTLATLVKSGVPILAALEIVGKTAGNKVIENAVDSVKSSIREGENISEPLAKSKVFPPMVVRMIAVGEQTGELEKMLSKVSDFYDDQVDAAISGITSLIEPLIIAFLGIVIGGIVICMFLPIFKIANMVS